MIQGGIHTEVNALLACGSILKSKTSITSGDILTKTVPNGVFKEAYCRETVS